MSKIAASTDQPTKTPLANMPGPWAVAIGLALGLALSRTACATTVPLAVGAKAPEVVGLDGAGHTLRLSQQRGKPAVVYFYPKDETPGCTKEACAFRDAFDRFVAQGVVIFGVSRDSEKRHMAFRRDHKLPFPLVSDESGAAQKAYGVPTRYMILAARVTFLVDRDGRIAHVWPDVDPGVHVDEVLAAVKALGPGTARH